MSKSDEQVASIQLLLLRWYETRARDLPWRRSRDPYAILVSEIMLQQTQVDRVIPKYQEFLERFPTLAALAAASPADVIRTWAPLGYNRRAVNLQRLATEVMREQGGRLPREMQALRRLPGVGDYTAAAVACFAFGEQAAVIDTNVRRVLTRLLGRAPPRGRALERCAGEYLPPGRAEDWNQALMDLGATICRASAPSCLLCPLRSVCPSRGSVIRETRTPWQAGPRERFRDSNRYLRGRIVELLRGSGRLSLDTLAAGLELEGSPGFDRLRALLTGLERDGLVVVEGSEPGSVRLPE